MGVVSATPKGQKPLSFFFFLLGVAHPREKVEKKKVSALGVAEPPSRAMGVALDFFYFFIFF
jgi:hypothetical protein